MIEQLLKLFNETAALNQCGSLFIAYTGSVNAYFGNLRDPFTARCKP